MNSGMPPIIDAHLDLAMNAMHYSRDLTMDLAEIAKAEETLFDTPFRTRPTVSLPELRRGGITTCIATVLARHKPQGAKFKRASIDYPTAAQAFAAGQASIAWYQQMERDGALVILKSAAELKAHWEAANATSPEASPRPLGVVLSMEGADPIVAPEQLGLWYRQGVRIIGLAHYGPHPYAFGTGSDGPLPPAGAAMLKEMDRYGVLLDLTHTTDTCFFAALDLFRGPVLASHNNCRALVPGDRQMADEQLRAIIARGGMIGVACDNWMLSKGYTFTRGAELLEHPRIDPRRTPRSGITLDNVADHIDHICQLAGNDRHVGIGSDLDGGFGTEQTPEGLDSIADLQKLAAILSSRNYSDASIAAILHGNWLRFLTENLGPSAEDPT